MGRYTRAPRTDLFRTFALAFWDRPRDGTIYGHKQIDVTLARRFQDDCQARYGLRPSMSQLVGRAVAVALTEVPEGNAKVIWGRPYIKDTVDVYFQVDVEDGKDLSGVVLTDVGKMTAIDVCRRLTELAAKLRNREDRQYEKTQRGCLGWLPPFAIRRLLGFLTFLELNLGIPPTFLGARPDAFGTAMVTNVSKFGIDVAYAPLVPVSRVPFIVLVGQVEDRPWVGREGQLVVRPVITCCATFDHRLLDGNRIGRITRRVVAYMTNPYRYEAAALGFTDPEAGAPDDGAGAADAAPSEVPAGS